MDTTVITVEPTDYGVGETDRAVFVDSKYQVDPIGTLHVYRKDEDGNVAAFAAGTWTTVLRGGVMVASAGGTQVKREVRA